MDLGLNGKRVLVAGGSAGIGMATARLMAGEGAALAIASRHPEAAAAELGVTGIAADLSSAAGCEAAVAAAVEALGGLDVLVNAVGTAHIGAFEEVPDERWQLAWDTNVMSAVRTIRAALPHLTAEPGGAIVNLASTSGKRPSGGMPEYSVTKAALLSLSRLVA